MEYMASRMDDLIEASQHQYCEAIEELFSLSKAFEWDADVMRCRECNRGIHVSRNREDLAHRSDCSNQKRAQPWQDLRAIIGLFVVE